MENEAVLDALQDVMGGFVTSFLLVVEHVDDEGARMVTVATAPGQPLTTSLGLHAWGETWVQKDLVAHLQETDDGE